MLKESEKNPGQKLGQTPGQTSKWISDLLHRSIRLPSERRVGIEIERLAVWDDGQPWLYRTKTINGKERVGSQWLLETLSSTYKWSKKTNPSGEVLGLITPFGSISLEPGSQVEHSSLPLANLIELRRQVEDFEKKVARITDPLDLRWLSLGVHPSLPMEKIDLIPSPRYQIMTDYFPRTGKLGTSMMRRTASIQLNFDYTSEAEAIEMLRTALVLAPLSYALFGNSPFAEGRNTGYLSFRGAIWKDTDPSRAGLMPQAFAADFSFEKYAQYLWTRPLMFAQDINGSFVSTQGKSINDIAAGGLPDVLVNEDLQHWAMQQLFTEARLKPGYIEVRSIDGLSAEMRFAAAAFWLGILYSEDARKFALRTFSFSNPSDLQQLHDSAIRQGLRAEWQGKRLIEFCRPLTELASSTLKERSLGEADFLTPLNEVFETELSPGAKLLRSFENEWNREISKVIDATTMKTSA